MKSEYSCADFEVSILNRISHFLYPFTVPNQQAIDKQANEAMEEPTRSSIQLSDTGLSYNIRKYGKQNEL
jgi:hypothetical protein